MALRKESASKVDDLYRRLKRQIIMSELQPGQQLVELELANALGCSQSTVREALLRLQEDGLIVRHGYRGTTVSPISPAESEIFLELRRMLEVRAARLSLEQLTQADIAVLHGIVEAMEEAARRDDEYALFEKDLEFHMQLFQIANLPALTPVLMRCSVVNHRNKIAQSEKRRALHETAQRHRNIIGALQAGNPDVVEEVVSHHVISIFGTRDNEAAGNRQPASRMSAPMRDVFVQLAMEEAHYPDVTTLPAAEGRRIFEQRHARWNRIDASRFDIERLEIPPNPFARIATRPIPAVRVAPAGAEAKGRLLYLHGGGWTFGSIDSSMGIMSRLAERTGFAVYGLDYALAPEHPFPCGLADCTWAWRWLRGQDTSGLPWFVAGDSSGANLALAMMIDLRDLDELLPEAAALVYGVYCGEEGTDSQRQFGQGQFGLTTARMKWFLDNYRAGGVPDYARARLFPIEADLHGLPPLLLVAAELDPLRDDTVRLASRLAQTDTPFEFRQVAGVIHNFLQWSDALPEAAATLDGIAAFIQSHSS